MIDNELIQLVDSVDIRETLLFNKKVKILGIRKTIIVVYIIDNIINIILFSLINPFYLFALSSSLVLITGLLNFNILLTKLQVYNLFSIFILKLTMIFFNLNVYLRIILAITLLLSIFFLKIVSKFYLYITNEITDNELESLQSGWQPRNIPFAL